MNITLLGGAGFIGTNLALKLSEDSTNTITVIDRDESFFETINSFGRKNIICKQHTFDLNSDFDEQVKGTDYLFHLASTIIPTTSNQKISDELEANIVVTAMLLDACVNQKVKKVVFISSGGTVYGDKSQSPISEQAHTFPINSYGLQKVTIEKMLHLYYYQYGLDYSIIRLSNPYGPYQRPNGRLGVVTTFIYHALTDGAVNVYGDGSIVRDFIYIDDAINGIIDIAYSDIPEKLFNLGSGTGTSVNEIVDALKKNINSQLRVIYSSSRKADVQVNYLDISRYQKYFGEKRMVSLEQGIIKTAEFLKKST